MCATSVCQAAVEIRITSGLVLISYDRLYQVRGTLQLAGMLGALPLAIVLVMALPFPSPPDEKSSTQCLL